MIVKLRMLFFVGVIILLSFAFLIPAEKNIFELLKVENLTVYTNYKPDNFEAELSGNGYSFDCSIQDYPLLKNIQGISFKTDFSPKYILDALNLKVYDTQKIDTGNNSIEIYYCYFKNLEKNIILQNKRVNLQIAFDGEFCILGIPILLGSY